ncbi:MAG: hypothetical protein ACR2LL_00670 [Nitrosopumilus sp.]
MKTILQLQNTEEKREDNNETKKIPLNETGIEEIFSLYFIWFMNNNIEDFQMFSKFCSQGFLNQALFFGPEREFN